MGDKVCHKLEIYFLHEPDGTHRMRVALSDASEEYITLSPETAEIVEWAAESASRALKELARVASERVGQVDDLDRISDTDLGFTSKRKDN